MKKTREKAQLSTGGYPQAALQVVGLPAYVCAQAWADYVAMRAERRAPLTDRAARLVIKRLMALHAEGYCPTAALEKSVRCGWLDVYPADRLQVHARVAERMPEAAGAPMPESVRRALMRARGAIVGN